VLRHLDDEPIPYATQYEGTEWISLRTNFYKEGSGDYVLYKQLLDGIEEHLYEESEEQAEE
tara:strand:- start:1361 stop:1543 length:183 start_codon:yes stop_codon:yes gene_type:complete